MPASPHRPPLLLPRSAVAGDSSATSTEESDDPVYAPPLRKASVSAPRLVSAAVPVAPAPPTTEPVLGPDARSSSPSSWDDDNGGGLLLMASGKRPTLSPSSVPFSRPSSTVTQPSRPPTAVPRLRKHSKRSSTPVNSAPGRSGTVHRAASVEGEFHSGLRDNGKGKAKEESTPSTPVFDPLDPLSSFAASPPTTSRKGTIRPSRPRTPPSIQQIPFPPSPSHPSAPPAKPPEPQSLQQLLQTVDLSAALRLVQTLQQQKSSPTLTTSTSPTIGSVITPSSSVVALPSTLPPGSPSSAATTGPHVAIDSSSLWAPTIEKDRRRSISLNLMRGRTGSTASQAPGASNTARRVPDERAVSSGFTRSFEEQISRVHLTLSPATMRRAQNCSKYISSRYHVPTNLLAVARWRASSGSTVALRTDTGWGKRRNRTPGPWEIYPDEIEVFYKEEQARLARKEAVNSLRGAGYGTMTSPNGNGWSTTAHLDDDAGPANGNGTANGIGQYYSHDGNGSVTGLEHATNSSANGSGSALLQPRSSVTSSPYQHHTTPRSTRSPSVGAEHSPARSSLDLEGTSSPRARTGRSSSLVSASRPPGAGGGSAGLQRVFRSSFVGGSQEQVHSEPSVAKSTFSRRLDQIRGKTDAEQSAPEVRVARRMATGSTTDLGSDGEFMRTALGMSVGRKSITDTMGGYKSSGGEEGAGRKKGGLWDKVKQGMKKAPWDSPAEVCPEGGATQPGSVVECEPRRRAMVVDDESDDEEDKPPREVLDLNEDEFASLSSSLRQLRAQLSHVDANILPRVPGLLNAYLDEMASKEQETKFSFGIPVNYRFPRLPASVIAELAYSKKDRREHLHHHRPHRLHHLSSASSISLTSSSDSSSDGSDADDDGKRAALDLAGDRGRMARIREDLSPSRIRSESRHAIPMHAHYRHSTDPITRPPMVMRLRSQTLAGPLRPLHDAVPPPRREPLEILEKALDELAKATNELDTETAAYTADQARVNDDIHSVVLAVDEVQQNINNMHAQKLQLTLDHYTRLRSSLERPSPTLDHFWAALAQLLQVVLYLARAIAFLLRVLRALIWIPIIIFRWLFFLH